jgi:hypothetical protein
MERTPNAPEGQFAVLMPLAFWLRNSRCQMLRHLAHGSVYTAASQLGVTGATERILLNRIDAGG